MDKFIYDPKNLLCIKASLIGGFYIKQHNSSKDVVVVVQSDTDYLLAEVSFGPDAWGAARKWIADCVFTIENIDVQTKVMDKKSGRMIRLDEEEGEG